MSAFLTRDALRSEFGHLWHIAWPLFIAQLAQIGTGVVDTVMAGHYSAQDLAAIGIGYNIWLPIALILVGVLFATSTMVAQDFGASLAEKIRQQFPQSLWVSVFAGLTLGPAVWFSEPLLGLLSLDPETQRKAMAYTQMVALGLPAASVFLALRFHTQGLGITKPFAVTSVIGFVANIPMNYALIYGTWGAPELGAQGCGIATALSMWLSLILIAGYMVFDKSLDEYLPDWKLVAPNWRIIKEIVVLGTPIGLTHFLEVAVFSVMGLSIATLGDSAMAAHQIAFNLWDVFFIPLLAIGTAMATRIGHAIGAGHRGGVYQALTAGSIAALGLTLAAMAVLLSAPEMLIALYTDDADIQDIAGALIKLAALFILMDAVQIIGASTLRAYKRNRFPLLVMFVSYYLVTLPLGWWLGLKLADNAKDGAAGFWLAIISGIGVGAIMIAARVRYILRQPLPAPAGYEPPNETGLPDSELQ